MILGKGSLSLRNDENKYSPKESFFLYLFGLLIIYLGYVSYNFIINFKENWDRTYSFIGHLLILLFYPFSFVLIVAAGIVSIIMAFYTIYFLFIFMIRIPKLIKKGVVVIKGMPELIKRKSDIYKRIWNNRGFSKYKMFGGMTFYLKLRLRILAFFLAFISLSLTAYFFTFKQKTYEKTYWKIKFYQKEPIQTFIFKPNIPYTIKTSAYTNSLFINYEEYENPNGFSEIWYITFPDTTYVNFNLYSAGINELFGQTLEVWENKAEGEKIYYPLSFRRKIR